MEQYQQTIERQVEMKDKNEEFLNKFLWAKKFGINPPDVRSYLDKSLYDFIVIKRVLTAPFFWGFKTYNPPRYIPRNIRSRK